MNHHALEPSLRIGKEGITEAVIKQLKNQLKKHKIIKVKFLPSAIKNNKKQLAQELAEKTNTKIVHKVGFIVVLEKAKSAKAR